MRLQVSHPYTTMEKIRFLCILNDLVFREETERQKFLGRWVAGIPHTLSALNFSMNAAWIF